MVGPTSSRTKGSTQDATSSGTCFSSPTSRPCEQMRPTMASSLSGMCVDAMRWNWKQGASPARGARPAQQLHAIKGSKQGARGTQIHCQMRPTMASPLSGTCVDAMRWNWKQGASPARGARQHRSCTQETKQGSAQIVGSLAEKGKWKSYLLGTGKSGPLIL